LQALFSYSIPTCDTPEKRRLKRHMTDLRILFVNTSWGWGGMEMHPLVVADGLARRGHPLLYAMRSKTATDAHSRHARFSRAALPFRWYLDPRSYVPLRRMTRSLGINVIHVHASQDTWRAMLLAGVVRKSAVLLYTKHSGTPPSSKKTDPLHRLLVRRLDAMVANSHYIRENALEVYPIDPSKVKVIHYGLGEEAFGSRERAGSIRRNLGLDPEAVVVGMVASLSEGKRQDLLIRAAKRISALHPECRFLLVGAAGQARYARRIRGMIETLDLEKQVILTGFLEDIPSLMLALDLFVLPSNNEAFGIVLLEAMANGRAIVGSRSGAVPEIVRHGVNGLLFDAGEPESLAEAILRLVRSPEERFEMGEEGRRSFHGRFSLERELDETERLYRSLVALKAR
jgi:glycosyltransferase involved in cell wall biosynthesis